MAVNCGWSPGVASTWGGLTATFATGVFSTVSVAMPDFPFELAAICVVPNATPVTTPVADTVATLAFCVDQWTSAPEMTLPLASSTIACNGTCAPTDTDAVGGSTATDATSPPCTRSVVALLHDATATAIIHAAVRRRVVFRSKVLRMFIYPAAVRRTPV